MTACCEGPLGAVRELLRPSWFTAEPVRMTSACGAEPAEMPGKRDIENEHSNRDQSMPYLHAECSQRLVAEAKYIEGM
jgi:hypothetical protein